MLVGDILLSAREAVPDLPGTLNAPASGDIHVGGGTTGGVLLGGRTYYMVMTYSTLWGETTPGPEQTFTIPGTGTTGSISLNPAASPYNLLGNGLSGAAGNLFFNVYLGNASGAETAKYTFPLLGIENVVTGLPGSWTIATPPQGNSAFLLDSSGPVASAAQVFRWFSDALNAIANANGGIPDTAGFATTIGRQNYTIAGDWKTINAAWYDGYPIDLGSGRTVFRHNGLNGTVSQISYTQVADTLVCELFPQPIRSAGVTSLSGAIAADNTTAPTNGKGGFVLPLGLAMFGTPPNYEVVSYAGTGTGLQQLVRGLGGTNAQAWPTNTAVTELNCMIKGLRAAQSYTVGQAANTIRLPSEWTPYIHLYLLGRYREIEQQRQEASSLMKEFDAYLKASSKRKPIVGERQIIPQDASGLDIRSGLSRTFGGVIIP